MNNGEKWAGFHGFLECKMWLGNSENEYKICCADN